MFVDFFLDDSTELDSHALGRSGLGVLTLTKPVVGVSGGINLELKLYFHSVEQIDQLGEQLAALADEMERRGEPDESA